MRSEVFETYALLAALMTGFCVCTLYVEHNDSEKFLKSEPSRYYATIIHQYLVRVCTALTLFSTFVFMLTTMYSKTALCRKDYPCEVWDTFTTNTLRTRQLAFASVYIACFVYMAAIPLGLFYCLHTTQALIGSIPVVGMLASMVYHARRFFEEASMVFCKEEELMKVYGERIAAATENMKLTHDYSYGTCEAEGDSSPPPI